MMDEVSTGYLLGVALVTLALVVLAAFVIFTAIKKTVGNSMTQTEEAIAELEKAAEEREEEGYDGKKYDEKKYEQTDERTNKQEKANNAKQEKEDSDPFFVLAALAIGFFVSLGIIFVQVCKEVFDEPWYTISRTHDSTESEETEESVSESAITVEEAYQALFDEGNKIKERKLQESVLRLAELLKTNQELIVNGSEDETDITKGKSFIDIYIGGLIESLQKYNTLDKSNSDSNKKLLEYVSILTKSLETLVEEDLNKREIDLCSSVEALIMSAKMNNL